VGCAWAAAGGIRGAGALCCPLRSCPCYTCSSPPQLCRTGCLPPPPLTTHDTPHPQPQHNRQELDGQLFEECRQQWEQQQQQQHGREEQRQRQWADVRREASKRATARGLPNGSISDNEKYTPLLIRSR